MVRTFTAVLMAMCLAGTLAHGATAEPGGDTSRPVNSDNKKEYPYELLKDSNGAPLRDEKGNFLVFDKNQGCIVALSVSDFAKLSASQAKQHLNRPKDTTVEGLGKKNSPPIIVPQGDEGMTVINMESPTIITDVHRRHAESNVSSYKNSISLSQVVFVKDGEVKGNLYIRNLGSREIRDMELTLVVPTGDATSERYRFRLSSDPDLPVVARPPVPNGRLVPIIVKQTAPAGAGAQQNERIHCEVTYLRFADE